MTNSHKFSRVFKIPKRKYTKVRKIFRRKSIRFVKTNKHNSTKFCKNSLHCEFVWIFKTFNKNCLLKTWTISYSKNLKFCVLTFFIFNFFCKFNICFLNSFHFNINFCIENGYIKLKYLSLLIYENFQYKFILTYKIKTC